MKNVVVTGGAGFIGSHLVEELVKNGSSVRIIDDLSTGKPENIEGLESDFATLDISRDDLTRSFRNADVVYHLAAIGSVQRSIDSPLDTERVNIGGTMKVLHAARDAGVRKFIYASSSSVYGDSPTLPRQESQPASPLSPYAASKLAGEYYCYSMSQSCGMEAISFRFFNVYGPRQDPHSIYSAVIPRFMSQAIEGKPFTIFGDGLQSRDFTYVKDLVAALVKAADIKSPAGMSMNLATGVQTTVLALARKIASMIGIEPHISFLPARAGEVRHSYADVSLANETIGFSPKYTLDEGLMQTYEWFKKKK